MGTVRSIALRLIGSATLCIMVPLIISGLIISHFFQAPIIQTLDHQIKSDLTSLIGYTKFSTSGQIQRYKKYYNDGRFNEVGSGWYWQIVSLKNNRIAGRSWSMKGFEISPKVIPNPDQPTLLRGIGPSKTDLKVITRKSVDQNSGETFMFLVAADPKFIYDAIERVNSRLFWVYLILGIGLAVGLILQVRFGLLPLKKLTSSLADIKEGRKKELGDEFPVEIKPLTDEMNSLLEHTRTILNRARTEVGNLAHSLKTPISVISNANRQPTEKREAIIQTEIEKIERHIKSYLARDKGNSPDTMTPGKTNILGAVQSLSNALEKQYFDKDIRVRITAPQNLSFQGSRNDLEEMLGNIMDNACKWCQSRVWVSAEAAAHPVVAGPMVNLVIEDDGPGIPSALREEIFERGKRADETKPGSGLGLSIVRQISALYGGDILLETSPKGGLKAILTVPGGVEKV
ncbi:MAG: ATP-binding protein [Pseudomonadota bacterium]|nr:ATP-binding protein [Pseudomonadota bacterium]